MTRRLRSSARPAAGDGRSPDVLLRGQGCPPVAPQCPRLPGPTGSSLHHRSFSILGSSRRPVGIGWDRSRSHPPSPSTDSNRCSYTTMRTFTRKSCLYWRASEGNRHSTARSRPRCCRRQAAQQKLLAPHQDDTRQRTVPNWRTPNCQPPPAPPCVHTRESFLLDEKRRQACEFGAARAFAPSYSEHAKTREWRRCLSRSGTITTHGRNLEL